MYRRALGVLLTVAVAVASVSVSASAADPAAEQPTTSTEDQGTLARGLIVMAKSNSQSRRNSLARTAEASLPDEVRVSTTEAGFGRLSLVSIDQTLPAEELDTTVAALEARADVEWAIPNAVRHASATSPVIVDDPYFLQQRNLWDARYSAPVGGYSTRAPLAWQATGTRGDDDVVVAVVDTGIVGDHPDLSGSLVPGYDFVDDDYVCDSSSCAAQGTFVGAGDGDGWDDDPTDPGDWLDVATAEACGLPNPAEYVSDSSWHGTHVAGIIAAEADNALGVSGIAPGVKIQPVRALGHCGGTDWDIAWAILWASGEDLAQHSEGQPSVPINATPADVINLSLGSSELSAASAKAACVLYSELADIARGNGATLVAAAGNDSGSRVADVALSVPAACDGYVAVGSTSGSGHRAWYSDAGTGVDLSAPGGDTKIDGSSDGVWSTVAIGRTVATGFGYAQYQGTSMASPAVAAGAALLYSLGATSPARVEAALMASVAPFPAPTSAYRSKRISVGGEVFSTADLNCTTSLCGRGILDLGRFTPRIGGTTRVGSTLVAQPGGWAVAVGGQTYAWRRHGTTAVLSTGSTYTVRPADLGRSITLTVSSPAPGYGAKSATSSVVGKAVSQVRFGFRTKVKKSKRYVMSVKVSVPGVRPTGKLVVYDGKKRIAVKRLYASANGRVKITVPKLKKGKHRLKVVYTGTPYVSPSTSAVKKVTSR